ncbi:MAG TPA: LysR family transcriptional regulator [Phenylobacterium sp.]|uniref:LysR family transcriptional regulator n=1 Tax=Phenylobacterium sp. TaxID=1871053 RepID=UPI002B47844E|nr:LysR family transcriptional regulator [Phenylobacterium sp.]HKR90401.1 LysR family transcriptional regulator [Phenylobacterium sp.]
MRKWDAYEAFVAVVEGGSFTAAAERLRLSKSAVSRLVSSLEERLGSQLIFRTTRQLAPTDLGRTIYDRCVEAFEKLETIDLEAMEHDATPRGRLRIVASDFMGDQWVAPLVAEFMAQYDKLEVELTITATIGDIVAEGFDVAIRLSTLADSTLRAQRVYQVSHICAASPSYLAHAGAPSTPDDLVEHNCLVSSFEACAQWGFRSDSGVSHVRPTGNWTSNTCSSLVAAALRGRGVVWLPELYLRDYITNGQLIEVLSDYRTEPMPVWCVYATRRHTAAKVKLFVDFLKRRLPSCELIPTPKLAPPERIERAAIPEPLLAPRQ